MAIYALCITIFVNKQAVVLATLREALKTAAPTIIDAAKMHTALNVLYHTEKIFFVMLQPIQ